MANYTCDFEMEHPDMGAFYGFGDGTVTETCSDPADVMVVVRYEMSPDGPFECVERYCLHHGEMFLKDEDAGAAYGVIIQSWAIIPPGCPGSGQPVGAGSRCERCGTSFGYPHPANLVVGKRAPSHPIV